jgi:cation diffusion facilitator family transporter
MAIEFLGGYYANSIAIFADAFHLLSDVSAYMISLYAVHKSHQTSPKALTFGYEKVQPLGALVNVAIIWLVTFELAIEATGRIFNREIVEQPEIMLGTSLFGLLCNLYIMRVLHSDEHAGGHHGCSHSHHAHGHAGLLEKSQHEHGEGCRHGHGNFAVEPEIHAHSHDCHSGKEHV